MKYISNHCCYIGEGPIWNDQERLLYHVNGGTKEILKIDLEKKSFSVQIAPENVASIGFTADNRMIISTDKVIGIQIFRDISPLYGENNRIFHANDGKVGPDGCFYVGTQSEKRMKLSNKIDGKLYRIDTKGNVKVLLDGLILSNGMDWNMAENKFYHTDSDTKTIKEYEFDYVAGEIAYTGRSVYLKGVDGFTIDQNDVIWATVWGGGAVAAIDTNTMKITDCIDIPTRIPASCCFCGNDMEYLAVVTAQFGSNPIDDPLAGYTFLHKMNTPGRRAYRFG